MRFAVLFVLFVVAQLGFSQLTLKPVRTIQKKENGSLPSSRAIAKNTLPFWDDFSITSLTPDSIRIWGTDTTRQWNYSASRGVLVNATLAKSPPTYRVASFDGLDENGQEYGTEEGLTDELVSDTLDLSSYNEADDIYFSFFWQAGGNVEIPDQGDSLVLQFYDPESSPSWETVWMMDGEDVLYDSVFNQEFFQIEQRYLNDRFVFRFQSYGDQDGPFDAWHLDWIYINSNRENEDYYYLDRGFTGQLTSPFAPFKALPIHQFKANEVELTSPQTVQAFNLDEQLQPTEYIIVLRDLVNEIRIDSLQFGGENPLLPTSDPLISSQDRLVEFTGIDLSSLPNGDSVVLQSELYIESSFDDFLDGTQVDLRINDTLRAEYLLHDYYAFDDGTAEYAVGTNIRGGQVGIQYWVEEPDTLTHIDIYFPNIDPSSDGNSLTLRIFRSLNDANPMRTQSVNIETADEINQFTRYELNRAVPVADTFYITYEQNVNEYIGIGFDRSNPDASRYIFEVVDEEWVRNDRLQGALMIRPIFKPVTGGVLGTNSVLDDIYATPNPTNGYIKLVGDYDRIQVWNLSGQLLMEEERSIQHDLSILSPGLYLLSIQKNNQTTTQKIIVK